MMREVKLVYPNGFTVFRKMSDKEISDLVQKRKNGCLVIKEFEIL